MTHVDARNANARSTAVSVARIAGAVSLFTYHYLNDIGLQQGVEYRATGPLGFLGYFGVSLFIIISGAVLGRSYRRSTSNAVFFRRRMKAIFSMFWWVAVPLIALSLVTGDMARSDAAHVPFWLLGLNVLRPDTFRPLVDAWWYIGLSLQVILVYPLVHWLVARVGAPSSLVIASMVVFLSASAVRVLPPEWVYLLDGFVGARFFELTFGVLAGRMLRGEMPPWALVSAIPLHAGLVLALSLVLPQIALRIGAGVSASVFLTVLLLLERSSPVTLPASARLVAVLAGLTYPFFLVHPPIVRVVVERVEPECALCVLSLTPVLLTAGILAAWVSRLTHDHATRLAGRVTTRLRSGPPSGTRAEYGGSANAPGEGR